MTFNVPYASSNINVKVWTKDICHKTVWTYQSFPLHGTITNSIIEITLLLSEG